MWEKLEAIEQRYLDLEQQMAQPEVANDHAAMARLGRDYSELGDIVGPYREALKLKRQYEQSVEELKTESDEELREMLKADVADLEPKLQVMEAQLLRLIAPRDPNDAKDCIVEIRDMETGVKAGDASCGNAMAHESPNNAKSVNEAITIEFKECPLGNDGECSNGGMASLRSGRVLPKRGFPATVRSKEPSPAASIRMTGVHDFRLVARKIMMPTAINGIPTVPPTFV